MTVTATIKIEMSSGASEAVMYAHLRETIDDIIRMQFDSWRKSVATDWEEEYPVEITIEEVKA